MTMTQVQPRQTFRDAYRRHGYFFKEAAILPSASAFLSTC